MLQIHKGQTGVEQGSGQLCDPSGLQWLLSAASTFSAWSAKVVDARPENIVTMASRTIMEIIRKKEVRINTLNFGVMIQGTTIPGRLT